MGNKPFKQNNRPLWISRFMLGLILVLLLLLVWTWVRYNRTIREIDAKAKTGHSIGIIFYPPTPFTLLTNMFNSPFI
jgi:protein-S-isoprenylcysteine O-methyltransferase Ste14